MKRSVKASIAVVTVLAGVGAWAALAGRSSAEPPADEVTYAGEAYLFEGSADLSALHAGADPTTIPGYIPPIGRAPDPSEESNQALVEELARRGVTYKVDASDIVVGDPPEVPDEDWDGQ